MKLLVMTLVSAAAAWAQCSYGVSPQSFNISAAANNAGTIAVTAASGCAWTAVSNATWLVINFGQRGTGNGTVGWQAERNPQGSVRTGTLTVAGATVTITQAAANCNYTAVGQISVVLPVTGGSGAFQLRTSCTWQATSSASWVTVSGGGDADGVITYSVPANPCATDRSAVITAGDLRFSIAQSGAEANLTLNPTQANAASTGGDGSFAVNTGGGCAWTASSTAAWLQVVSATGTGPGTVAYRAQANSGAQRTATIAVPPKSFLVTQQAAQPCSYSVLGSTSSAITVAGGSGSFVLQANCAWQASSTVPWITVSGSGSGNGSVSYTVAANPCATERTGFINAGDARMGITQAGAEANLTLNPTQASAPAAGGDGVFAVATGGGCAWTASSSASWLTVVSGTGSGGGQVSYRAQPNAGVQRSATVTVAPKAFSVTQAAGSAGLQVTAVAGSADYSAPPVAPGEIVAIFGTGMGPAEVALGQLTADQRSFTNELTGTRVLFDGAPAAMIYTSAGQVSAVVPYGVAGQTSTSVAVEYNGVRSAAVTVAVRDASPAIFTLDQSGTGSGAILNQDYTVNGAANAAARGSVIQIYCTGTGVTLPPSFDGLLTVEPFPQVSLPVVVTIGGANAKIWYSGGAPGAVAGLTQINAEVPLGVTPGPSVAVKIKAGDRESRDGVTVSVK